MEKRNKKSSEYWEKRIASRTWKTYNTLEEQNRDLLEFYQEASNKVKKELYALAEKCSRNGVLSRSEVYRKNHLKKLKEEYEKYIWELGGKIEKAAVAGMEKGFQEVYQNISDALEEPDFPGPDKKLMEELRRRPWRGGDFSRRLWKSQKRLSAGLNNVLRSGLQQGKTATEIAIGLQNLMGNSFNACHRLVRTETMHYLNSAALRRYQDAGVGQVQFWAAADERTCEICGAMHEKVYALDRAPILPVHPNCRCTYLPVLDEKLQLGDDRYILRETTDRWTREAKDELMKDEKSLSRRRKETAVIYGANGKFLFQKRGDEGSVVFSRDEILRMKDGVVSHNHPSGGSFSTDDIWLLKRAKMAELRAITEEGVYYIRPPKKWPSEIGTRRKMEDIRNEIKRQLAPRYQKLYLDGKITKKQRHVMSSDAVSREFARRYGFAYGKEGFDE